MPILSHILFANDTFLFLEASTSGYSSLIHILDRFEALNGQLVNLTKYTVYFSSNTPTSLQQSLGQQLHVSNIGLCDQYVGLSIRISCSHDFSFVTLKTILLIGCKGGRRSLYRQLEWSF